MILFLDIDGPMIPARSFIFNHLASINQELDETCVKILFKIIEENNIKQNIPNITEYLTSINFIIPNKKMINN
jgi:hypothetical protein